FTPTDRPAQANYRIYDARTGKALSIDDLLKAFDTVETVCVGELHNDAAAHAFEAELFKSTLAHNIADKDRRGRPVVLSLEMFERDVQVVLDEYLRGLIAERHFLLSSRPWNNYQTDYRPLLELAREHKSAVLAANAPARYVNRVSRLGPTSLKDLPPAAKAWLPPLPYKPASTAYAAKFKQLMSGPHMTTSTPGQQSPHGNAYLLDAQTLRDATMAYAITERLKQQPTALVFHVGGSFHSEERLGLPEQITHYRKRASTLVITIVPDKNYPEFDAARLTKLGDIIVLTPPLPRSF
ncbi:MAG: ChaN family lipoprotein, partial [Pyrinomonadaceae bacterium]|nr:ChaN family lipoprotein [Pyrinomonadaceae bacterium]